MSMMTLPVSGRAMRLRAPDGADDLAIAEARGGAVARALAILPHLASLDEDGGPANWPSMSVTDFEFALLALRTQLFGDEVSCVFDCPRPGCGERVEIDFNLVDLLADIRPNRPRGVRADAARPGWFRFERGDLAFRLPTALDQVEVLGLTDAKEQLERRCVDGLHLSARMRDHASRAMEQLAPAVSRPVEGKCPHCERPLAAPLVVPLLVVDELQRAVAGVHNDIHLIAQAYHWSEPAILALSRARRQGYAQAIRRGAREAS